MKPYSDKLSKRRTLLYGMEATTTFPFYKPDLMITVVDPHRPGHEIAYHPGEVNVRMADVVVINKEDTANF